MLGSKLKPTASFISALELEIDKGRRVRGGETSQKQEQTGISQDPRPNWFPGEFAEPTADLC